MTNGFQLGPARWLATLLLLAAGCGTRPLLLAADGTGSIDAGRSEVGSIDGGLLGTRDADAPAASRDGGATPAGDAGDLLGDRPDDGGAGPIPCGILLCDPPDGEGQPALQDTCCSRVSCGGCNVHCRLTEICFRGVCRAREHPGEGDCVGW